MTERGTIRNRESAAQIRDFSGLRWGTITPTDIDGAVEFQDKAYVLFELKYGESTVPYGQRLAIERMCRDLHKAGKPVLGMIARHNTNPSDDIRAADADVVEVWVDWGSGPVQWRRPNKQLTVKEAIDIFLNNYGIVC